MWVFTQESTSKFTRTRAQTKNARVRRGALDPTRPVAAPRGGRHTATPIRKLAPMSTIVQPRCGVKVRANLLRVVATGRVIRSETRRRTTRKKSFILPFARGRASGGARARVDPRCGWKSKRGDALGRRGSRDEADEPSPSRRARTYRTTTTDEE